LSATDTGRRDGDFLAPSGRNNSVNTLAERAMRFRMILELAAALGYSSTH
jgi:hypothetical protein